MTTARPKPQKSGLPLRDNRWYGRRRDLDDPRDYLFAAEHQHLLAAPAPIEVDLRGSLFPKIYNQGRLGSCVGNGVAAAFFAATRREHYASYRPSRLFIYYGAREIEGTIGSDAGCEIRDGIKVVAKLGAPHETLWPYRASHLTARPSAGAYADGLSHEAIQYARIDNSGSPAEMIAALAGGLPIVFGITVFESFEWTSVAATGKVPMPASGEAVLGGHCMVIVGYRGTSPGQPVEFIVRNSWGADWGDAGSCYMPRDYLIDPHLASDFWVLSRVA